MDVKNYIKFKNPYLSNISKVSYLQRMLLIHSYLYYELDNPVITDVEYDNISKQLCMMYNELTDEEKTKTEYFNAFYDFEGSTGFYLCDRLDEKQKEVIEIIASHAPQRIEELKKKGKIKK